MHFLIPWLVLGTVLVGHFGFWLLLFNRVNGTGLQRPTIKRIEKVLILVSFAIPIAIFIFDRAPLVNWLFSSSQWWPSGTALFDPWSWFSLATVCVAGPVWLESRRGLFFAPKLRQQSSDHYQVAEHVEDELVVDRVFRWFNALPGNQITQLEVTRKEIELGRTIEGVDGLKIGHLSDIHLTGKISQAYYQFAIDRLLDAEPDLIVIAGDIIDYARCLPWIEPLFAKLRAPLGCSFVLGNHDRRLSDITPLLEQLQQIGFHDLGASDQWLTTERGLQINLVGNELPWFSRRKEANSAEDSSVSSEGSSRSHPGTLNLGLSHSPDQFPWARQRGLDLLLAGHTHGGQVRIPGIGPIVAPSYFGSRYASGVFYSAPTVMHVGRGLCGVHPVRWYCLPEVAVLTLRNPRSS